MYTGYFPKSDGTRYYVKIGSVLKMSAWIEHPKIGIMLTWSVVDIELALPKIKARAVVSGSDCKFFTANFTSTPINVPMEWMHPC